MTKLKLALILNTCAFALLGTVASTAAAQPTTETDALPAGTAAAAAAADASAAPDEIVVTGSRIARPGMTSSTPTVSFASEEIAQSGAVNVGDVLREIPAISPGLDAGSSAVTFAGSGLNLVDLRSLGTNRTLVLINNRRQVGSEPNTTATDINSIPTALIERVDVITGGASAVYGADAVSGVVNFILKRDFEGVQLEGQAGLSSRGDGERFSFGITAGTNFADGRGNVTIHTGYSHEGEVAWNERPGAISGRNWVANPANTGPNDGVDDYILLDNVRQIGGQMESAFILNRGNGPEAFAFNPDGSVRPFGLGSAGLINGTPFTNGGEAEIGFDAQCPQARCQIRVPVERILVAGQATYEVSDNLELFLENRFAQTKAKSRIGSVFEIPPFTNNISIDNPYVTPSLRALMQQAGVTSIGVLRSDQELGPRGQNAERRLLQLTGGIRGDVGLGNFRYDTYASYGSTRFVNTRINDKYENRSQLALDAVRDPADGVIKCRSVVEGNVQDPGCVPINFLLPGAALTEAQLNWIRIPFATETAELRQLVGSASVTGDLIELWAGPVSIAVGTEWREEKSVYLTSDVDQQGLGFFNTRRQSTRGQFDVLEFFGEAIIPVLRDLPFAESAEIELAVRRSDYSTAGVTYAWKAGANWSPVRDIRFRGVLARAVRAPNVGELFSPASEGFLTVDDPCDVNFITGGTGGRASTCSALGVPAGFISNARTINIRTATAGNPELDVEKADTLTLGVVLAPRFVPGLSITADYYDIKIEDAINVFSAQDILNNCVDIGSIDNPFCQSISRAPGGAITQIRRQSINVSEFHREGIDVELRYRLDFEEAGVFDLSVAANRALAVETIVAPGTLTGGTTIDELGEIGNPKWKARAAGRYTLGGLTFNATVNYLSSMVRDVQPVQPEDNRATTPTGDFWLTDLQVGYDLFEETNVFFGVDNVFDRQPPSLPETRAGGAGSFEGAEIYPTMGRYFYVGARTKF